MPWTSMWLRRNDTAAVEITAFDAGAGPPANRIPTRRMFDSVEEGPDNVLLIEGSVLVPKRKRVRSSFIRRSAAVPAAAT